MCFTCANLPDTGFPEFQYCLACQLLSTYKGQDIPASGATTLRCAGLLHKATLLQREGGLRESTVAKYLGAVNQFQAFCRSLDIIPLPATVHSLRAFATHQAIVLGIDPSTIAGKITAISDWHRRQITLTQHAGLPAPENPCKAPAVTDLVAVLRKKFRATPRGRLPITKAEFYLMMHEGFILTTASGHHRRLCLLLSTLGCLRRTALTHLRIFYAISEQGTIQYLPESQVSVHWDSETAQYYIRLRIIKDKNVHAHQEIFAYIPGHLPNFHLRPLQLLEDYLRTFRPPSGGLLCAAPRTRHVGPCQFYSGPYSQLSRAFKDAYGRAFPDAHSRTVDIDRVASHSGRKSLAQWLFDAHQNSRLLADVGHWARPKEAVNIYFTSSIPTILRALLQL